MQSFRTELEQINHGTKAVVEKDIIELDRKIREFKEGLIPAERFRSLRLARGVYGQRQQGVQMIRIKLPFGKITTKQLLRIADISDEYSNGNLHLTTRQDIQIHHVSLEKTPELWAKLEQDEITLREACGNTVRNITASAEAGIDPDEPFDVSPYAHALFVYFLRKPFGQELGRKIKIAFSNNDADTAVTYIHDFGFIPKLNNNKERGFKVLIGGGLGAQPFLAQVAYEFLPEYKLIPFVEASIRVFDRHGERASRNKARLKYLIQKIGLPAFLKLTGEEENALIHKSFKIDHGLKKVKTQRQGYVSEQLTEIDAVNYQKWLTTNTFKQKQEGYFGVYVKVALGNISSDKARLLALIADKYSDPDDLRITINQNILLKYVTEEELPYIYHELQKINLADPGYNSVADITACPGTDTCNLAISNSTSLSLELEKIIRDEFPYLIYEKNLKIKISGCMNSCGQHGLAQIGFHGSSFKVGTNVVPALQVLLGGGTAGDGKGRVSEKVIKVASKRAPDVLRKLFSDFEENGTETENFNAYYDRKGKDYFYQLLKPIGDNSNLTEDEFYDWDTKEKFETAIGVGECAGVIIDLVQTLFYEADEKLSLSAESFDAKNYGDSIYFSYAAFIHSAKALLLDGGFSVNTHHTLIADFDKNFVETGLFILPTSFRELVLQINKNEPGETFATKYFNAAKQFILKSKNYRETKNKLLTETLETLN